MMEEFTKGPWSFDYSSGCIEGGNSEVVCKVGDDWGNYKNADANAALIAAAPEMYDMLKAIASGGSVSTYEIKEMLAKARGEK